MHNLTQNPGGFLDTITELSSKIAGEISLSDNPSETIKKWRELFGLTQSELARYLRTTPSVVSDYESGRRRSPGTKMIRKFVSAAIKADYDRGHPVVKSFEKSHLQSQSMDVVLDMREFRSPLSAGELAKMIDGHFASGEEYSDTKVYGYTIIDSLKAILEFSSEDFLRLYGTTTQRALIFTKVTYGRSPLIAVRVSNIKPKVIIMHGIKEIDKLGVKIAQKEMIPVIVTETDIEIITDKLRRSA